MYVWVCMVHQLLHVCMVDLAYAPMCDAMRRQQEADWSLVWLRADGRRIFQRTSVSLTRNESKGT